MAVLSFFVAFFRSTLSTCLSLLVYLEEDDQNCYHIYNTYDSVNKQEQVRICHIAHHAHLPFGRTAVSALLSPSPSGSVCLLALNVL
jgi:hypothetical protein